MDTVVAAGRDTAQDYWRRVLAAGGVSAVPRWTRDPAPGVGEHEVAVPDAVAAAARRLADERGVPLSAVLLGGHAVVLAALCGEREVVTGYVAGGRALPCRLSTESDTWRGVLAEAGRAEAELLAHRDVALDGPRRELGVTGPLFETVFDPTGEDGELGEGGVLWVGVREHGEEALLRLRYRRDVLDEEAAGRIAGYHLTALSLLTTDVDAEHRRQSLLSAEELRFQLEGLAGPRRELPDRRAHELFEARAAAHRDAVAAVHADRRWTYGELNARANRLARALLARGLRREGVVAVVTERNLDWLAAVLAVFKAGGVYLPIEPHFPADRIATTLRRAEAQLALTEPASTATLDQALAALPGVQKVLVDSAYPEAYTEASPEANTEDHAEDDLGVAVGPDQLAYIYFTSGSTGEPKGAMCEHAGMLNHLFAKIEDLGIGEGSVVAQVAPQCFDISLWQLISALMVGGQTLIIPQDVILDVERFVDTLVAGRVNVAQVVPSYLEVVLSYLDEHPRELPDLRCVSVTGEALKMELAQRWFATKPDIKLVNAYGLTETSDDTNHEVMERAPEGERVPLGPAVINTHVYVVDEHLRPVPLGAPGEIVFSGVCVGRGYINDPERTRAAFGLDPHRPGERLYRSGDHGRWRPDGKLEFLGRRDTQVKIRGFRIEIGEIENTLLRVPGVRDGAVVVAEHADHSKHLVAFYSGPAELDLALLRERLGASLPEYMVPSVFHRRESLPLTPNGKIDKKKLAALAVELAAEQHAADEASEAPATPAELRVAAAWSKVLGIPTDQISRHDHFFDRGGTSLSAVKLAIALNREVSLKEITAHPVLADLAGLLEGPAEESSGLLQQLSGQAEGTAGALVCFPYAGGNAVNFQPLATALRGSGLAVYAVELPGHDIERSPSGTSLDTAKQREPFAPVAQVAEQVAAEISERGLTSVMLWGHSAGTALALATARKLAERGVEVRRVFLGAQLIRDAASRRAWVAELRSSDNAAIIDRLSREGGYPELGELDPRRAEHVAEAYRHDAVEASQLFAETLDSPPAVKLSAPVTAVVAADDPSTADYRSRFTEWELLAERVELHELADGGHYFLRTRPTQAAQAVLRAADLIPSS